MHSLFHLHQWNRSSTHIWTVIGYRPCLPLPSQREISSFAARYTLFLLPVFVLIGGTNEESQLLMDEKMLTK